MEVYVVLVGRKAPQELRVLINTKGPKLDGQDGCEWLGSSSCGYVML